MAYSRRDFAPGAPNPRVARFTLGTVTEFQDKRVKLISLQRVQVRHNALEAARVAANKKLVDVGEANYFFRVKVYPHIILRENKMIATAGADRLQEGMRKAFGKPVGLAARVEPGSSLMEVDLRSTDLEAGKAAMKAASSKLPTRTRIEVEEIVKEAKIGAQPA
jgi:large subunit ribosomal protein L10e